MSCTEMVSCNQGHPSDLAMMERALDRAAKLPPEITWPPKNKSFTLLPVLHKRLPPVLHTRARAAAGSLKVKSVQRVGCRSTF
jgi:hypothetical protein